MTLGEKLAGLRKENHYTQEQLAELLGVSRQAVSKWESDAAYPETEKLIRLGDLYDCSMDYLLKEKMDRKQTTVETVKEGFRTFSYERKSTQMIGSLPLWHINLGYGRTAKGVIAVGLSAKGICAIGVAALGLISFGVLPIGLLAFGALAAGIISVGAISVGVIAIGAIAVGLFALGSLSIGSFAVGALAIGDYAAMGDSAHAAIALGKTEAAGTLLETTKALTRGELSRLHTYLETHVPVVLAWARQLFLLFVS